MSNFIFILDGDAKDMETKLESIASKHGQSANVLFLPGNGSPEQWIWGTLKNSHSTYAEELGMPDLLQNINNIEKMVEGVVRQNKPVKVALSELAETTERNKTCL